MLYRLSADLVVVLHLVFIVFVVTGGFLALKYRRLAWVHLPVAFWGVLVEFTGWTCPLYDLENKLRLLAGEAGYDGGFIEHYLIPIIYPGDFTVSLRITLGVTVLLLNGIAYTLYFSRRRSKQVTPPDS